MRGRLGVWLLLLSGACFVDDVTESGGGPSAGAAGPGGSDTGGADPASGAGPTTGGGPSTGGAGGAGGSGGVGGAGGSGGSGGTGGAGGCTNHFLAFDDDDAFIAYDMSFDFGNDFSFGARVRLHDDPKFAESLLAKSAILGRVSTAPGEGWGLGVTEITEDGQQHYLAIVFLEGGVACSALDPMPAELDVWKDVRVFYKKSGGGTDLRLEVEGHGPITMDCGNLDTVKFGGDLDFGMIPGDDSSGLYADVDDIFVKSKNFAPVVCEDMDYVTIFTFEGGDLDPTDGILDDCAQLTLEPGMNPPKVVCE